MLLRILALLGICYLVLLVGCTLFQRRLIYLPSHDHGSNGLVPWNDNGRLLGFCRPVPQPKVVWLFLHGNAGQASDRAYILPSFAASDAVHILEYPGYGRRQGSPSRESFNAAAREAYELLRMQYPATPVCVAAESVGTGPASYLGSLPHPPDKLVLITPFDRLSAVASRHYPFLPVSLVLRDNWDNAAALKNYRGQVELFAASDDSIIPISHARALASAVPSSLLRVIAGNHNDWSDGNKVAIRFAR